MRRVGKRTLDQIRQRPRAGQTARWRALRRLILIKRLEISLVVFLGDDVIESATLVTPAASAAAALACSLDAEHDKAVMTRELLLVEQPSR